MRNRFGPHREGRPASPAFILLQLRLRIKMTIGPSPSTTGRPSSYPSARLSALSMRSMTRSSSQPVDSTGAAARSSPPAQGLWTISGGYRGTRHLARLWCLRNDLIDPAIAAYYAASSNASGTALSPRLRSMGCWANSRYRQYALANRICSGVRQSASNTIGEATRTQRHWAREVATLSRLRL
jgi:hypothetical protein